jgi:electron transport complex protein RnfD
MTFETMGALAPALILGVYFFGTKALLVTALSVGAAVGCQYFLDRAMHRPMSIQDGSAALIGLLLAMLMPVGAPWWSVIIGAAVAIFLGRQVFGGLGGNPFNAVLVGYLVLLLSWPASVEVFYEPRNLFEGVGPMFQMDSSELPLALLQYGEQVNITGYFPLGAALIGNVPGGIGSTSVIFLVLGGLYLIGRGIIQWEIPVGFLGGMFVFGAIFWMADPSTYANPFYHLIFGYSIIGAFFLAPDPATSPFTSRGALIFAAGAGVLTMIIRYWGAYVDGVIFALMFFNALTPMIDRLPHKSYGRAKAA